MKFTELAFVAGLWIEVSNRELERRVQRNGFETSVNGSLNLPRPKDFFFFRLQASNVKIKGGFVQVRGLFLIATMVTNLLSRVGV